MAETKEEVVATGDDAAHPAEAEATAVTTDKESGSSSGDSGSAEGAGEDVGSGPNDGSRIMAYRSQGDRDADHANYFVSYAYLFHQKEMLEDEVRMRAYHDAIMKNRHVFEGKRVLDVGAGSGILSVWSAQAGAAKVYAVEFTDMAKHAQRLVDSNGVGDIVTVLQTSVEELELDEPVDVIVSEWMGYFLLRESMLDSAIRARDRFLNKETGVMFPSHATMYWAAVSHEDDRARKFDEYYTSMHDWRDFKRKTSTKFGVDMGCLEEQFEKEQREYYIKSAIWSNLGREHVVGAPVCVRRFNLHTCTLEDARGLTDEPYEIQSPFAVPLSGFAGWFTVDFVGSENTPCTRVVLSTAPEVGYTHWGQQVFYLQKGISLAEGDIVRGTLSMDRQKANPRLYDVAMKFSVWRSETAPQPPRLTEHRPSYREYRGYASDGDADVDGDGNGAEDADDAGSEATEFDGDENEPVTEEEPPRREYALALRRHLRYELS